MHRGQGSRFESGVTSGDDDDSARFIEWLRGLREYLVKVGLEITCPAHGRSDFRAGDVRESLSFLCFSRESTYRRGG